MTSQDNHQSQSRPLPNSYSAIQVQRSLSQSQTQSRWKALTERSPSSHSSFLYGVKSTKIYCRPTCSARLARRANIVYYDTRDQAERDGFRPCKRCKPDDATFLGEHDELVMRVLGLLRQQRSDGTMRTSLKELAADARVSPSYLCRVFKKTMGITVGTYIDEFEKQEDTGNASTGLLTPPSTVVPSPSPALPLTQKNAEADIDLDDWLSSDCFLESDRPYQSTRNSLAL